MIRIVGKELGYIWVLSRTYEVIASIVVYTNDKGMHWRIVESFLHTIEGSNIRECVYYIIDNGVKLNLCKCLSTMILRRRNHPYGIRWLRFVHVTVNAFNTNWILRLCFWTHLCLRLFKRLDFEMMIGVEIESTSRAVFELTYKIAQLTLRLFEQFWFIFATWSTGSAPNHSVVGINEASMTSFNCYLLMI